MKLADNFDLLMNKAVAKFEDYARINGGNGYQAVELAVDSVFPKTLQGCAEVTGLRDANEIELIDNAKYLYNRMLTLVESVMLHKIASIQREIKFGDEAA